MPPGNAVTIIIGVDLHASCRVERVDRIGPQGKRCIRPLGC